MKYQDAKDNQFATGEIPNGYFGDVAHVGFTFDAKTGRTIVVHAHGTFTYHTPYAQDEREAYWLLKNHPSSNAKHVVPIKTYLFGPKPDYILV